ncbi:DsbA family protein [Alsobacter sp. SYSU M60028]|uniref:DsbA family protein n=1 Tax=Alsobacter ponti TaxID=2962936 RepID=A0ABT1LDH4_9HYPH|nr:DsbA family protein [Alsobacter ponti]MCP8939552.1 DsbA family protein [Alsobacter ponti]
MTRFAFTRPAAALALAASLALGLACAPARAQDAFSDKQKAAIGDLVKEYLLKNPEVIQDALVELDRRQKDAEKQASKKALGEVSASLVNPARSVVLGNPQGDVTLVEFMDYNCTYCKRSLADVRELIKNDPKLKVVIRDFPVLGPDSVEASVVAVALKNQVKGDKYWEFHQKLMESRGRVGKDRAMAVAKETGADMTRLAKDMESVETRGIIEEAMRIGDALRLQGTPAFILGEDIIFGAVGLDPLRAGIASMRQCGKANCG